MMGVLALRAGVETDISVRETTHQWSGYAQMVIGVAPLLFGTVFVYSLLNHGYKRQIKNVPLEVMASIKRETEAKATRAGEARPATNPLGANTAQESEQELSEMTGAENLRGGLHHRYSSLSVTSRQGANSYSAPVGPPPDSPAKPLLQNNQSLLDGYPSEDFPDPEEELETENTLPETDNMDDFNDALALSRHVEPPMSRVPGILDAPLGASIVEQGDHDSTVFSHDPTIDDLQLHTYLHPALIGTFFTFPGKLPVAWLPISNQRLEDLRNDQTRLQQQIWQRIVSKQQVGFYVLAQDEREAGDEDFQPRIRSFIDGVSSWVHLLLS